MELRLRGGSSNKDLFVRPLSIQFPIIINKFYHISFFMMICCYLIFVFFMLCECVSQVLEEEVDPSVGEWDLDLLPHHPKWPCPHQRGYGYQNRHCEGAPPRWIQEQLPTQHLLHLQQKQNSLPISRLLFFFSSILIWNIMMMIW